MTDDESLGLSLSTHTEESEKSTESDDSSNSEKSTKKKLKFPDLHAPSLKIGELRSKRRSKDGSKAEKRGHRLKFKKHLKSIFGDKSNAVNVEGEAITIPRSNSSEFQTTLKRDGSVLFNSPGWKMEVTPITLSSPALRSPNKSQLSKGEMFAISKQELWEGGVRNDNNCSKHYYTLSTAPQDGRFSLKLNLQGLHGKLDKDTGYVIFRSQAGKAEIVYAPAMIKQANDVAYYASLSWNESENTISVDIPAASVYPVSLVFLAFNKLPTSEEISAAFGLEHSEGQSESDSDSEGKQAKGRKKLFNLQLKLPKLKFDKKIRALYGKIDPARLDLEFKISSKTATLPCPAANLDFALSADGSFTVGPTQSGESRAWSVRIVSSLSGFSDAAQMYKGGAFVSARVPDLEQGASTFADTTKHFFLLSKGGSYSLRFEGSGIGKIHHDESGKTFFSDSQGHPLFVYSKPSLRVQGKRIAPKTTFDQNTNELHIEVPKDTKGPIGVVCAICTCTLPPQNVIYAVDDGFFVLHPRVNFIGYASQEGITYKPLKNEGDPWSITFSLADSQVANIYAKSKCTVALERTNNFVEFLSYVDRGEVLGLHHTFHITAPPTDDASLRIPIAITHKGITQVTQDAGTVVFHAAHGPVFAYGQLRVCDAHGTVLRAQMSYEEGRVALDVMEQGEYPLIVS